MKKKIYVFFFLLQTVKQKIKNVLTPESQDIEVIDSVKHEPEVEIIPIVKSESISNEDLERHCDLKCYQGLKPCSYCMVYKAQAMNDAISPTSENQLISASFLIKKLPFYVKTVFLTRTGSDKDFEVLELETPVIRPGSKIVATFKTKKKLQGGSYFFGQQS